MLGSVIRNIPHDWTSEELMGQKQVVYLTVFLFWHVTEANI